MTPIGGVAAYLITVRSVWVKKNKAGVLRLAYKIFIGKHPPAQVFLARFASSIGSPRPAKGSSSVTGSLGIPE